MQGWQRNIKHFSTLKNRMFCGADDCCRNADLLRLPVTLSGLGTNCPYTLLLFSGNRLRAPLGADICHGVISRARETRAEEFSSFPLYPESVAGPREEPERAITSTMVPLIVTYFWPAGRTRCCKMQDNNVIVNCTGGLSLRGHLHEHIRRCLSERTRRKSGLNTGCRLPCLSGEKMIWTESWRKEAQRNTLACCRCVTPHSSEQKAALN